MHFSRSTAGAFALGLFVHHAQASWIPFMHAEHDLSPVHPRDVPAKRAALAICLEDEFEDILQGYTSADTFCQSYLNWPAETMQVAYTPIVTTTVISATSIVTVQNEVRTIATVTQTATVTQAIAKRAPKPTPAARLPRAANIAAIAADIIEGNAVATASSAAAVDAAASLSSACSCRNPPRRSTVTATFTAPASTLTRYGRDQQFTTVESTIAYTVTETITVTKLVAVSSSPVEEPEVASAAAEASSDVSEALSEVPEAPSAISEAPSQVVEVSTVSPDQPSGTVKIGISTAPTALPVSCPADHNSTYSDIVNGQRYDWVILCDLEYNDLDLPIGLLYDDPTQCIGACAVANDQSGEDIVCSAVSFDPSDADVKCHLKSTSADLVEAPGVISARLVRIAVAADEPITSTRTPAANTGTPEQTAASLSQVFSSSVSVVTAAPVTGDGVEWSTYYATTWTDSAGLIYESWTSAYASASSWWQTISTEWYEVYTTQYVVRGDDETVVGGAIATSIATGGFNVIGATTVVGGTTFVTGGTSYTTLATGGQAVGTPSFPVATGASITSDVELTTSILTIIEDVTTIVGVSVTAISGETGISEATGGGTIISPTPGSDVPSVFIDVSTLVQVSETVISGGFATSEGTGGGTIISPTGAPSISIDISSIFGSDFTVISGAEETSAGTGDLSIISPTDVPSISVDISSIFGSDFTVISGAEETSVGTGDVSIITPTGVPSISEDITSVLFSSYTVISGVDSTLIVTGGVSIATPSEGSVVSGDITSVFGSSFTVISGDEATSTDTGDASIRTPFSPSYSEGLRTLRTRITYSDSSTFYVTEVDITDGGDTSTAFETGGVSTSIEPVSTPSESGPVSDAEPTPSKSAATASEPLPVSSIEPTPEEPGWPPYFPPGVESSTYVPETMMEVSTSVILSTGVDSTLPVETTTGSWTNTTSGLPFVPTFSDRPRSGTFSRSLEVNTTSSDFSTETSYVVPVETTDAPIPSYEFPPGTSPGVPVETTDAPIPSYEFPPGSNSTFRPSFTDRPRSGTFSRSLTVNDTSTYFSTGTGWVSSYGPVETGNSSSSFWGTGPVPTTPSGSNFTASFTDRPRSGTYSRPATASNGTTSATAISIESPPPYFTTPPYEPSLCPCPTGPIVPSVITVTATVTVGCESCSSDIPGPSDFPTDPVTDLVPEPTETPIEEPPPPEYLYRRAGEVASPAQIAAACLNPDNLVENSGFELPLTDDSIPNWSAGPSIAVIGFTTVEIDDAEEGDYVGRVSSTMGGASIRIAQPITLCPSTLYALSVYARQTRGLSQCSYEWTIENDAGTAELDATSLQSGVPGTEFDEDDEGLFESGVSAEDLSKNLVVTVTCDGDVQDDATLSLDLDEVWFGREGGWDGEYEEVDPQDPEDYEDEEDEEDDDDDMTELMERQ